MYSRDIFVDREKELELLDRLYDLCVKNVTCGVIVYGWRKVGKTTLIKKFLERRNAPTISVNCGWLNNPQLFTERVLSEVRKVLGDSVYKKLLAEILDVKSAYTLLFKIFELLDKIYEYVQMSKPIIFLDEFHLFLEKTVSYIAKKENLKGSDIKYRFYWFLKDLIERKNCFWIFASSIGWEKLAEITLLKTKAMEVPLIGVLERLLIKPLDYDSSIKLAIAINKNIRMDEAREIAEISGGIPKHIISIALRYRAGESVIKTAELLLDLGEFDEVFESMLRFLAEIAKRDFSLFVLVLKAIAEGNKSTEKIAEYTGLDKSQAYYILEELKKLDLIRKTKKGKFVIYDLQYPLLGAWLLKRVEPININREKLLQMLGITAESYIRELLRQIKNRIEIWDDKRGTYLAGTANKIELERMDVLDLEDTKKFLAKIENADIICKTKEGYLIIEVKAKDKPIVPEDVKKLNETLKKLTKKGLNVKGILIQVGYGEILPTAVVEAVKNNIIIITREGIRLLAKKLDFPPI